MHRYRCVAAIPRVMFLGFLIASCGSYDNPSKNTGTGGAPPATGGATGGSVATGGATTGGASTGGASTGGASTGGASTGGASGGESAGGAGGSSNGGAPAACAEVAACGGDVVGTWKGQSCKMTISGIADMVPTGLGCNTAEVTGSLQVSGTWTANADGTFADATTTTGEAVLKLAKECLTISGFSTTCDRIVLDPLGLNSVVCVDDAATEGCTCTATIAQPGGMAMISLEGTFNPPEGTTGTYTAADNKVTTTVEGNPTEYSYCVQGSTLTMNLATPSKVGTITGPIVLEKQ